jgi:uncharacterized OB-fold protein
MKKPSKPSPKKSKGMDADDHRKKADKHRAMASLHEAKASMLDVDDPPKRDKYGMRVRPY